MAIYTEATEMSGRKFVSVTSRYIDSPVIYYSENKFLTFPIYKKQIYEFSDKDKFYSVTPGTQYRPDLISYEFYGTPDFWWKIMQVNDIKDVFEIRTGMTLRLPDGVLL